MIATNRLFGASGNALIWLASALFFFMGAAELVAANVAETLFVKRVGPGNLPYAFVVEGILVLGALNYVGAAIDRGRRAESLIALLIAAAVLPIAFRAAMVLDQPLVYAAGFVLLEAIAATLLMSSWLFIAHLAPTSIDRSIATPIAAIGLVGQAVGAGLSAPVAALVGVESTVLVATFFAAGAALTLAEVTRRIPIRLDVIRPPKLTPPGPRAAWRHISTLATDAVETSRRSNLLRYLLAISLVAGMVAPFVELQLHVAANEAFTTETDLIGFYALVKAVVALAAAVMQLLLFRWLRRRSGVANLLLVLPLALLASFASLLYAAGLATAASIWSLLRLGAVSIDEPARHFLEELFPPDLRARVDWLVHRTGSAIALVLGSLLLVLAHELAGMPAVVALAVLGTAVWLIIATLFRARYARLVLQTSLMNRVDFDQLRPESVAGFLDDNAVRQLEREVVSGVPARAQLAIELLRQIHAPRLPLILSASYLRQPPVLRPLFLSTIQQSLRDAPIDWSGLRGSLAGIARLARSRLTTSERAVLIRVYGEAASRHTVDPNDVAEFLGQMSRDDSVSVKLAVAGARYRLDGTAADVNGPASARPELNEGLNVALHSSEEQDLHLAISEVEELVRFDAEQNGYLVDHLIQLLEPGSDASTRVRAHVVGSVTRLSPLIDAKRREELDVQVVPLALESDPRLAAAALEYMRDVRYLPLLDTHVLPNLTAGNHHVRECAAMVVRHYGKEAVPVLLDVVRSGGRRERMAVSRLLGGYPVARRAHRDLIADELRGLALKLNQIQMLHTVDHPAPYALLATRLDEEASEHVRTILRLLYAATGDESLIRIERQLWSRDTTLRRGALEALDHLAREHPETSRLRSMVDDTPLAERASAARDLVQSAPTTPHELLANAAVEGNWVTRLVACHTIAAEAANARQLGLPVNAELASVLAQASRGHRSVLRLEAERALKVLNDETTEGAAMTTVERMLLLKETELFRGLDARDLAGIAGVLKEVRYAPGDTVMKEGDRGDFLIIIASGHVDIVKNDGKGGQFHIRSLGKAEAVGDIALLEEGPRSASVLATEPCSAVLLGRAEFESLIEEYPGVALGMARVLSQRLRTATTAQAASRSN